MYQPCRRPHWRGFLAVAAVVAVLAAPHAAPGQPGQKRLPVPDAAELAKARKLIQSVVGTKELDRADALKVAENLLEQSRSTTDDDALRYAGLDAARDIAEKGGHLPTALKAVTELDRLYEVQGSVLKAAAITRATQAGVPEGDSAALLQIVVGVFHEAIGADDYDTAAKMVDAAYQVAGKKPSLAQIRTLKGYSDLLDELRKEYQGLKKYLDVLKEKPLDPEANLQVGRFHCFAKGQWNLGLPLLAKGGDEKLRAYAEHDLAPPKKAAAMAQAGDHWMVLGEQAKPPRRDHLLRRAYFWYEQALPDLDQAGRNRVYDILTLIEKELPGLRAFPVGEIRKLGMFNGQGTQGVAFLPDGKRALVGCWDKTIRLFNVDTGEELRKYQGHTAAVYALALSADGKHMVTGGADRVVRYWDVENGTLVRQFFAHNNNVHAVALVPGGKYAVSCDIGADVRLWDLSNGNLVRQFFGHNQGVFSAAVTPDGKHLLTGSQDSTLRLWEVDTGKFLRTLTGHTGIVYDVAFTPDGKRALSCGVDATLRLWDVFEGKELRKYQGHVGTVWSCALSADGKRALSGGDDRKVRVWDVESGKEVHAFDGHPGFVTGVRCAPDGQRALSVDSQGLVRLLGLPR